MLSWCGLLGMVVVWSVPVRAPGEVLTARTLARAIDALSQGDDEAALAAIVRALPGAGRAADGSSSPAVLANGLVAEARFVGARAALNLQRPDEALALLAGLEQALPEVTDFVLDLTARAHRQRREWSKALAAWKRLRADFADSPLAPEALYGMADAQYALGRLESAERAYSEALERAPRLLQAKVAQFNIARLRESLGRWQEAGELYRQIAYHEATTPFSSPSLERLDRLVRTGRTNPPSFHTQLARLDKLLASRLLEQVSATLDALAPEATTRSQQTALAFRRAQLAYRLREFDTAVELFNQLAGATSGSRRLTYEDWIGRCYSASDKTDEAISLYTQVAGRFGGQRQGREALFRAAWLAYNGRRHESAVRLFSDYVRRYPSDNAADEALWYLAWNTYRLGDLPTAVSTLRRLRSQFPSSSLVQRAHYWEGRYLLELGRAAEAETALRAAIAAEPFTYYGVFARQRLAGLARDLSPIALAGQPLRLASLKDSALGLSCDEAPEPLPEELPEAGGFKPVLPPRLPWGGGVLDWDSADGRRALRLARLGLALEAADIVKRLPTLPGQDRREVAYGRARVLYALGDFNSALRIASNTFADQIRGEPRGRARRYFQIAYPPAYGETVTASAREFDVSPLLVFAVMRQESAFNTRARSWASAHGLMQIIPVTGERIAAALDLDSFSPDLLNVPQINVRFGTWYLAQLLHKFDGNPVLALASYNAGPHAVTRWVERAQGMATDELVEEIPYRETRQYVKLVLGNLAMYEALYGESSLAIPERLPQRILDNVDF